jgi:hypothetical protein
MRDRIGSFGQDGWLDRRREEFGRLTGHLMKLTAEQHLEKYNPGNEEKTPRTRTRSVDLRLRAPVVVIWSCAALSAGFVSIVLWSFGNARWTMTAFAAFALIEVGFALVGLYWLIVGWRHCWTVARLGGIITLIPVCVVAVFITDSSYWVGGYWAIVVVRVVDGTNGAPIKDAAAFVTQVRTNETSTARTDSDGLAKIGHRFTASGRGVMASRRAIVHFGSEAVRVEADGYEHAEFLLDTATGPAWDVYGPAIPIVEVRLERRR